MNLAALSIRRPVFALMLILGLVVLGLVSLDRLNLDLNPDVDFPFVTVTTVLRGASPETMEREVTDILEEQVNTIEGIRTLRSTTSEGLSNIFIEFELDYDVDTKAQQVRDKVDIARPLLPLDIEDPVVSQLDPDSAPILSVMVGGPVSIRELSELAENVFAERLERLPGVGSVDVVGSRKREVRIWLDPARLAGYGLSIGDVTGTLREENQELAGGRIEGHEREWSVTTYGKVQRVEDFGSLIVAQRGGRPIYLRDVAVIEDGLAEEESIARLNGERGVSMELRRRSGANTVAVARAVRAEVAAMRESLPPGIELVIARDMATFIETSIHSVLVDMIYAGLLVVAVVLFFLHDLRSTFISSLAIPASVIASFTFFYLAGFTLNNMTLMALSLAIGLVIDDAIVVLEAIYRRVEHGEERLQAAEAGSSQVGLAVVSTTLAVCGVFVPIAFMEGTVGQWFYEFGLVVAIAVCVSTLFALTLTPMLASRILRKPEAPGPLFRFLGRLLDRLDAGYRWLLERSLRRQGRVLALAALAILGGCAVASTVPFDFYRSSDRGEFTVFAKLPIGTPLPVTDGMVRRMEAAVREVAEVRNVFANVGVAGRRQANIGSLFVDIGKKQQRQRNQIEVMAEVRRRVLAAVPEAEEISVSEIGWVSSGGRDRQVDYSLQGPDLQRLERYADRLVEKMSSHPDFVDASSSYESGKPEIRLTIMRDVAADLGVPAVIIGQTIRTLLAGEKVGSFEEGGERYDVRVQVLPEFRDDPEKLDMIRLRSLRGELVPLTNVARAELGEGAVRIERENRTRQISVGANLAGGAPLGPATAAVEAWGKELDIQPPDALVPGSRARTMRETGGAILFAFLLALAAIYMILASLFNSLIHPFTIMMSAPLSFIGGFLALKLSGMSLDMMSGIGLLVLMGLVMKNGILLVDYTNQLRAEGLSAHQAALEAGPVRLRPVLMTTGALVLGLTPVAFGASAGSEARAPMGVITVGGLLTSTLLTLVVVPVVYLQIDGLQTRGRRLFDRLRSRFGRLPAASTVAAEPAENAPVLEGRGSGYAPRGAQEGR